MDTGRHSTIESCHRSPEAVRYLSTMAETFTATGSTKDSWSANEASCVTGVPLKQVHRIIDAGLLGDAAESRNGARVVLGAGLIGLKLAYQLGTVLTPEGRRRLIRRLLDEPTAEALHDEPLSVDVRVMAEAVHRRIALLAQAKRMVETDDGVLGGTPCFKGTRIPIHDIAHHARERGYRRCTPGGISEIDRGADQRCADIRPGLSAPRTAAQCAPVAKTTATLVICDPF